MKKVLGVIFIVLAVILFLAFMNGVPGIFEAITSSRPGDSYDIGYLLGLMTANFIEVLAIYFLFKYGLKWVSRRTSIPPATAPDESKNQIL